MQRAPQFNSFSCDHRPGVSSIKRLSIPLFLWNSIWLGPTSDRGQDDTKDPTQTSWSTYAYGLCQKHLGAKSRTAGAAAAEAGQTEDCSQTLLLDEDGTRAESII